MEKIDPYMARAIDIASRAPNSIKTNPKVGCVIVYQNKIIGEGIHKVFGEAHAEINAINSIQDLNQDIIDNSIVYVTLEPCSHLGKTPSCARTLVKYGFKNIVIGTPDPHHLVNGKGIEILKNAGCNVNLLSSELAYDLIREFRISSQLYHSYICLKWAQTKDGYMGRKKENVSISCPSTQYAVHLWRSQFQGILIGPDTAIIDNPRLNNRLAPGDSPIPILIDRNHRVPKKQSLFSNPQLIYISHRERDFKKDVKQIIIPENNRSFLKQATMELYKHGIKSIFVEGGKAIHSAFIKENLWHEARIILSKNQENLDLLAPRLQGKNMSHKLSSGHVSEDYFQLIYNNDFSM